MTFEIGDRVVHRSQRLDTLNTVEWIVYHVATDRVSCRAIVQKAVIEWGVPTYGSYCMDASFHPKELVVVDEKGKAK